MRLCVIKLFGLESYEIAALPHDQELQINEYVAVTYQNDWYAGVVEKGTDIKTGLVRFMARCRIRGYLQWPVWEDKQIVKTDFVLKHVFFLLKEVDNGNLMKLNI